MTVELKSRLTTIVSELRWEHLADLFGAEGALIALGTSDVDGSQEIHIWGKSPTSFVVVWSAKGKSDAAIGTVTADSSRGLINQVYQSVRPDVKQGGFLNASDWTNFEQKRGAKLSSMAAHPVTLFGRCVAVLSLSLFEESGSRPASDEGDAQIAGAAASLLGRLVEDRLIRSCLGLVQT